MDEERLARPLEEPLAVEGTLAVVDGVLAVVAVMAPGVHEVRMQVLLVIGVHNPQVSHELFNRALMGHRKLQKSQTLSIGNASFMMYAHAFSQFQGSANCVIDLSRDHLNASMRRALAPKAAGQT